MNREIIARKKKKDIEENTQRKKSHPKMQSDNKI